MAEELFLANDNNITRINNSYPFVESKKERNLEQYIIFGSVSNFGMIMNEHAKIFYALLLS